MADPVNRTDHLSISLKYESLRSCSPLLTYRLSSGIAPYIKINIRHQNKEIKHHGTNISDYQARRRGPGNYR
jgi:hypothetical protein